MKILIFGGTTEGGRLARLLSENGHVVTLSVVTRYALSVAEIPCEINVGRMDESDLIRYLETRDFEIVVDATHPYAELATRNIKAACRSRSVPYLRLLRENGERHAAVRYVGSIDETVRILAEKIGKLFLTIGSKELEYFTRLDNFAARCYVRILPMVESLQKTIELGFRHSNVICMQGPFSVEANKAMLKATGAKYLVTKDSGEPGGVDAKIEAALQCDCRVLVVERPTVESGYSFEEICEYFHIATKSTETKCNGDAADRRSFFPLFFNLHGKRILVVGGGKVALRRIGILHRFGANLKIVSPEATGSLQAVIGQNGIEYLPRKYVWGDVKEFAPFLTIAATDCRETNEAVAREARENGVPVIVSDCREECDCYFPAIAESESLLAGIVSKNGDHHGVRKIAQQVRQLFTEQ